MRAAIRLADRSGLGDLSMRRLASALRVEAMSLYNHVPGKDALLDGMVDLVLAEIAVPAIGGDWKRAMRARAISAHEVFVRHPWAPLLVVSRVNVGPAMLRYVDATLGCLVEAGFTFEMADRAMNALDSHLYGFTLQALNFPFEPSEYAAAAKKYFPMLTDERPYMRALTVQVIEGTHTGVQDFEFGLDLLLDGLERALDRKKGRKRR